MAQYEVTLKDGRVLKINADTDAGALGQALHEETSRISSERHTRLGAPMLYSFSEPDRAVKVGD